MSSSLTGTLLIISLIAIALCGTMACLDFFDHYSLLASSMPTATLVIIALLITALGVTIAIATGIALILSKFSRTDSGPDPAIWHPLQLAFSDGILNTKVF